MPAVMTRKERQVQTREQVIAAAARVFARRGYHRATVEEIASEAGFPIGALYSNFAARRSCSSRIADRQTEARVAEIEALGDAADGEGMPAPRPPISSARFLEADPDWPLLFYEFWSLSVRNPELQGELAKRRDAIRDALAETLERVAERSRLRASFPGAGARDRDRGVDQRPRLRARRRPRRPARGGLRRVRHRGPRLRDQRAAT